MKVTGIPVITSVLGKVTKGSLSGVKDLEIGIESEGLGDKRTSGDHLDYGIVEIGQNIEKSPGDKRCLDVTQNPVENHRLMLVWKTRVCT